jgi:hypothetical protein
MIAAINSTMPPQAPTESTPIAKEKPLPFTVDDRVSLSGARDKEPGGESEPAPL